MFVNLLNKPVIKAMNSVIFTSHVTKNTSAQLDLNTYSYNSTCDQFDGNTGNCKFSIKMIKDSKKNQETTSVHAMLYFFYYFVLFQKQQFDITQSCQCLKTKLELVIPVLNS
jgi:hypothetical protein